MEFKNKLQKGGMLLYLVIVISLFSILMLPILDNVILKISMLRTAIDREGALQIAEAGINYYQWHLAHFPDDYVNDVGVHDFIDTDTHEKKGEFNLVVTPPNPGSTVVTIQSTGHTERTPSATRTITVQYGIPSLAKYSFLSNEAIWIGDTETVVGPFMSNGGIRFDGSANASIKSAKDVYAPPEHEGYYCPDGQGSPCPAWKDGIWSNPDPPADPDVKNLWQFPVSNVDYSVLTFDLAVMQEEAENDGIFLLPSNVEGYSLVFNSDGTVTIYKVDTTLYNPPGYDYVLDVPTVHPEYTDYDTRTLLAGYDHIILPTNGIIYVKDNVWVEGTVRGKVTVVAATLPYTLATAPSIFIPHNIVYSAKDGSDSLGLIGQQSVLVSYHADNDLEINAAMIAQNGSCEFYYWPNNFKNSITVYGSTMTYGMWTWGWVGGVGYPITYSQYDPNLLYAPPPSFPLSTTGYQQLNWKSN